MPNLRTFIAIELSDEAKAEIGRIRDFFLKKDFPLALPKKDTLHLTLVFLGNVEEDRLKTVFKKTQFAAGSVRPFLLELSSLGAFPNFKLPKVLWVGLRGEIDQLKKLTTILKEEFEKEKFDFDEEKFVPHITCARIKSYGNKVIRRRLGEEIQRFGKPKPVKILCTDVAIFKSVPTSAGHIHKLLKKIPLGK